MADNVTRIDHARAESLEAAAAATIEVANHERVIVEGRMRELALAIGQLKIEHAAARVRRDALCRIILGEPTLEQPA